MQGKTYSLLTKNILVRRFLEIVVLVRLNAVPSTGYAVTRYILNRYGVLVPWGNVNTILHILERENLIRGEFMGRRTLYFVTAKGEAALKDLQKSCSLIHEFADTFLGELSQKALLGEARRVFES